VTAPVKYAFPPCWAEAVRTPTSARPPWESAQFPAVRITRDLAVQGDTPLAAIASWHARVVAWLREVLQRLRDAADSLLALPPDVPSLLLPSFPASRDLAYLLYLQSQNPAEHEEVTDDGN
jgi:hypothetical protein